MKTALSKGGNTVARASSLRGCYLGLASVRLASYDIRAKGTELGPESTLGFLRTMPTREDALLLKITVDPKLLLVHGSVVLLKASLAGCTEMDLEVLAAVVIGVVEMLDGGSTLETRFDRT